MNRTPYPQDFHFAHMLFEGKGFAPGGEWGDTLDGPIVDEDDVIERIYNAYWMDRDTTLDRTNLRVFAVESGEIKDVTQWALECLADKLEGWS